MYKPVINLINGEIIKDLLDLCNEHFIITLVQPYAGANREWFFCGESEKRNGKVDHSVDCPAIKYQEIVKKHNRWIVKN